MVDTWNDVIVTPFKKYKGTCVFAYCETDKIETMKIRDDDTWVLSFPRSGTTLTQEIVYLLKNKLAFEEARNKDMDERFPFLDWYDPAMPLFRGFNYIQELPSPRLIKSHLHYHCLPEALMKSNCKKVYVMRNPKDVFISHYMLSKYFKNVPADLDTGVYLNDFLNGEKYATPWWLHIHDFWLHRDDPNILFLTYENIVKDMPSAIRHVAAHLNEAVTDDEVDQIANFCSFKNMKVSRGSNSKWQEDYRKVNMDFGGHIRKGKVGGWRDYLTPEQASRIDSMVQEKLGHLDIKFDYGS